MSAKEMFEELGFKKVDGYTGIMYIKETFENFELIGKMAKRIFVHFVDNKVNVSKIFFIGARTDVGIDMELLKAINKQCEELGWLKDSDIK